ncbi:hypothetical protein [Fibrobacter sp. UWH4]|uniref:hypothetical protein n=1 Tax=Fibrobacter sp. UWH4 TaxID=1896210 RepID=UPI000912D571|nr:hypothetical protein [Fibrobacter sp. UWH4]SHL03466.1 hypothetical protein SAMN05720762_10424 [Fibrobacter sp. UWH4]
MIHEFKVAYRLSGSRRRTVLVNAESASDARNRIIHAINAAQQRSNRFVNLDYCEVSE